MDNRITEVDPNFVSDMIGSLDARVHKLTEDIQAITELIARMHVDLYVHINDTTADPESGQDIATDIN